MTWQELEHGNGRGCPLPSLVECEKYRAEQGDVYKCGTGCGRLYLFLPKEGVWNEVVKIEAYAPLDNQVRIIGVDPDQDELDAMTDEEREFELKRREREAARAAQAEIARKRAEQQWEYQAQQQCLANERVVRQLKSPTVWRKLGF